MLAGLVITFGITFGCIIIGGGIGDFLHIPSLIISLGVPIGLALMTFRPNEVAKALLTLCCMSYRNSCDVSSEKSAKVLRQLIIYFYSAGIVAAFIGWIQMLHANMDNMQDIALGFSISILTIFYALIISEFLLRPGARRIEASLSA